jgi:menaquinone-9 beta-reductase
MDVMHDVVIAGGGPAGAVAALVLARAGARVLVLDRARFPRPKLCGDSVNPGAMGILRRLDVAATADGGLPIGGMLVSTAHVEVEGAYAGLEGRTIRRADLDEAVLRAAGAAGAEIDEGVLVEGPCCDARGGVAGLRAKRGGRAGEIRARIVIAADGRYSRVARALGLQRTARGPQRWAIGAYYEGVTGLRARGEMHIRAGHYIGVAPLPGGLANACVVTDNRAWLANPAALLGRVLASDARLAPRFLAARAVSAPVCLGPLGVEASAAGVEGLLLAGDAAGFIDPMTGDGLRFAFAGADLAAGEALRALEHGRADAHLRLAAARRRAFAGKWRFNRALRLLVSSPAAITVAGFGASVAPGALRQVIRHAGDVGRAA